MSAPKIELIVSAATTWGTLDLFADEQILMNLSVANIKDITAKNAPFSQTFYIPGTANNNQILTSIFEIGINSVYDPRKKAQAQLLVNNVPVTQNGFIQLTNIDLTNRNEPNYQIVIFDQTKTFFDSIDGKYLTDLNFSELNHVFSISAMTGSWTAATPAYEYFLSDFGYNWGLNDVNGFNNSGVGVFPEQMFPSTQAKYIWDKIFAKAGYSYTSNFLNSSGFTGLYIPYNSSDDTLQNDDFCTARTFQAQLTANTQANNTVGWGGNFGLAFSNASTNGNFNHGNFYDASGSFDPIWGNIGGSLGPGPSVVPVNKWTADTPMSVKFNVQIKTDNVVGNSGKYGFAGSGNIVCLFHRSSLHGGPGTSVFPTVPTTIYDNVFYRMDNTLPYSGGTTLFTSPPLDQPTSSVYYPAKSGETFWVTFEFHLGVGNFGGGGSYPTIYSSDTFFYNTVLPTRVYGQTVPYNAFIPQNIKQTDFINSLCKMHNLYIEQDSVNANNLIIEPRDDYYAAGKVKDWTNKLDTSKKITQQLLSEQQKKTLRFKYKDDNDYANEHYLKARGQSYGDYINIFDNDFTTDEEVIDVVFSPTPSKNIVSTDDFIVPFIAKEVSTGNYGQTNFNIRILQKNQTYYSDLSGHTTGGTAAGISNGLIPLTTGESWKLSGQTFTVYPYAGHLNTSGFLGDDTYDLNWGEVSWLYYNVPSGLTTNNLVNTYWYNTLQEINDKNSYMMTCYLYLTPTDINNLRFNDIIFIDGVTQDGGVYWKINSIEYNASSYEPSKVELIKSLNELVVPGRTRSNPGAVVGGFNSIGVNVSGRYGNITNGNNVSYSNGTFMGGDSNTIGVNSDGSFVTGFQNNISTLSPGSMIIGGSGNTVIGANNILLGVYDTILTGETSNTTYVTNLTAFSSITIGNTTFTASGISGSNLWTGSTGSNSIIANNNTGNLAYGSFSIVGGKSNSATSTYSFIANGGLNQINGNYSFIGGGYLNSAVTSYSSIVGGRENKINDSGRSFIGSGGLNVISGTSTSAAIVGGQQNTISNSYKSFIGAGITNTVSGNFSSIVGGQQNLSSGGYSFIGGGRRNSATTANFTTVVGGYKNLASGLYSFIGGGQNNLATANYSSLLGGRSNSATGLHSSSIGGGLNITSGAYSVVGGRNNKITSQVGAILSGYRNSALTLNYSTIVGGYKNLSSGLASFVGNGALNSAVTSYSIIVGGGTNLASGVKSFIGSGNFNTVSGQFSSTINGISNTSSGNFNFIGAGSANTITANHSSIVCGTGITASQDFTAYVPNIAIQSEKSLFVGTGGTNPTAGIALLGAGGTATVTTNKITNSSVVMLTAQNSSGTPGEIYVSSRTAGTSFVITSTSGADTRTIGWQIIEPF